MLASTITNLALSIHKKKGVSPKYTKVTNFIPDWSGREKEKVTIQTPQEMKDILLSIARRHNAKLKGNKARTKPPKKRER